MEFGILGPIEVRDGQGRSVDITAPKQRALLAILLIAGTNVVSTDSVIDQLWGEHPPADATGVLHVYVSHLRAKLEPHRARRAPAKVLVSKPPGYSLMVDPRSYDAFAFAEGVTIGERFLSEGRPDRAIEAVEAGLRLWRGPALVEFLFEGFALSEATRLEELKLVALETRVDAALALGRHGALVPELEALVRSHPLRERLWGSLMVAFYRAGRQSEALRAFQQCRATLTEELGIEPGPQLRRLEQDILHQSPTLSPNPSRREPATVSTTSPATDDRRAPLLPGDPERTGSPLDRLRPPHNLLRQRSILVGRQEDLARLETLLAIPGLVTLVGPGGVGKTRLATELGHRLASRYPDGVWMIELGPIAEAHLVPQAVATVFGVREEPHRLLTETLAQAIKPMRTLIVLDNCEHLLAAAAALTDTLLAHSEHLTVLTTSREPLRTDGEVVWRAHGLEVPPEGETTPELIGAYSAVQMFCERAARRGPFELDTKNATGVAALCRRLDGIPLALELAAARTSGLSVGEILDRLENRFRVLTLGLRSAPARHQTLRATVNWSYDALDEGERRLFNRISVFAGSFSLRATEVVCRGEGIHEADVADLLSALADKSMVVTKADESGTRYRLLETLRVYAQEKLAEAGEVDRIRHRHLNWLVNLAEDHWPALYGPGQVETIAQLTTEHQNLRAALRWSLEAGAFEAGLRIARALFRFWICGTRSLEGLEWLQAILIAAPAADPRLRADALVGVAGLAFELGRREENESAAAQALMIFTALGDGVGAADALDRGVPRLGGDWATTAARAREALALWQAAAAADPAAVKAPQAQWVAARSHIIIGHVLLRGECDPWAARASFERGLAIVRRTGDLQGITLALTGLGQAALEEGQAEEAGVVLAEALHMAERLTSTDSSIQTLNLLGGAAVRLGHLDRADQLHARALSLAMGASNLLQVSVSFDFLAVLANARHQPARAAQLAQAAMRLRTSDHVELYKLDRARHDDAVEAARRALGDVAFRKAWGDAERLTVEEIVTQAARG